MKNSGLVLVALVFGVSACSGSRALPDDAGVDHPTSGTGGVNATGGTGTATGGAHGGTPGSGGGAGFPLGGQAGVGGSTIATGGVGGSGPSTGSGGAGGGGGRAQSNGGASGKGGGSGGASAGGNAGSMGGRAGSPGSAGASGAGPLQVTFAQAAPANQLALIGVLVAVDSQDGAVVVGPASATTTNTPNDPGPAISWFPRQGASRRTTYPGAITPSAMVLDRSDAIWMVGQLYRSLTLGGATLGPIDNGYYLAKVGPDGSPALTMAVPRAEPTNAVAMVVDGAGNVYVTGELLPSGDPLSSGVFVTKFSPTGAVLFDQKYPDNDTQAGAQGIALAPNGDVVIAGFFNATLNFGSTTLTSLAGTSTNGFAAILNASNGTPKSAFSFGGKRFDSATSVQVASNGNLRIAGDLSGVSTVGGMKLTADANSSPFVAELTPAGNAVWVRLVEGNGFIFRGDTNAADRTFCAGRVDTTTTGDAIVAAAGADGVLSLPLRTLSGAGNGATAVAADHHGGVWVGGEFQGNVTFGSSTLTGADPTQPTNFIVHLEP